MSLLVRSQIFSFDKAVTGGRVFTCSSWSRKQEVANWLLGLVSGQGHVEQPPPRPLKDHDGDLHIKKCSDQHKL